jgi:DNA repair protein RadA/Sms
VLYVSGEESVEQVKLRSHRLGLDGKGVHILPETDVDQVLNWLNQLTPAILIVDSIQTLYTQDMPSAPGTVAQVRECARRLMSWAKTKNAPVLVAGHVTKDGTLAGPRVLEHMVDVVLYLEGERTGSYRLLRSVKNRFGSTNELGVFQMGSNGLEEVTDPSQALLSERPAGAVGSAIVSILEGSRPLLVEVQALNSPSVLPTPRRVANGADFNRLLMLVAVLTRRAHLNLSNQDIIVNVVGGVQIEEPAADLAIALAIASSYRNVPLPTDTVAMGEIGLSGEVRSVTQPERRLAEVERLGFTTCAVPAPVANKAKAAGKLELLGFSSLSQAIATLLPRRDSSTT